MLKKQESKCAKCNKVLSNEDYISICPTCFYDGFQDYESWRKHKLAIETIAEETKLGRYGRSIAQIERSLGVLYHEVRDAIASCEE